MAEAPPPPGGIPLPETLAGNFQDAARWFTQMWSGNPDAASRAAATGVPSMMMPTLDVKELDKRIADMRSVENWLKLNLGLLQTTIQGLEMQRNTVQAWQQFGAQAAGAATSGGAGAGTAPSPEAANFQPALWWNALQQQFAQMAASAATQVEPQSPAAASKAATGKVPKPPAGTKA